MVEWGILFIVSSIYALNEFYYKTYDDLIDRMPVNGNYWHSISEKIIKDKRIVMDHFSYNNPCCTVVSSKNRYFVRLLSWHKWNGIPNISSSNEQELMVKFLNEWHPTNNEQVDFEILNFFEDRVHVKRFIENIGLTVNDKFNTVMNKIVDNNQKYYRELRYLEDIVEKALNKQTQKIDLLPYQQAVIMSMIETKLKQDFRLVNKSFTNTNEILNFLEE